jgi:hypothetical protein
VSFAGVTLGFLVLFAACGGDGGATPDEATDAVVIATVATKAFGSSVTPSDRAFAVEDLTAAGLKFGKSYDIEGLPGATAAHLMFHNQKDVEVRFFPSHEAAVNQGVTVAREIVGPDAVIKAGGMTWDKAIGDERACSPGSGGGIGGGRDCTRQPKYGDFIVYANFIMFCEGKEPEEALPRCQTIVKLLKG